MSGSFHDREELFSSLPHPHGAILQFNLQPPPMGAYWCFDIKARPCRHPITIWLFAGSAGIFAASGLRLAASRGDPPGHRPAPLLSCLPRHRPP